MNNAIDEQANVLGRMQEQFVTAAERRCEAMSALKLKMDTRKVDEDQSFNSILDELEAMIAKQEQS
jgi:hypothetical protein